MSSRLNCVQDYFGGIPAGIWISLIVYKFVYVAVIVVAIAVLERKTPGSHWRQRTPPKAADRLTAWDGVHYLRIAQSGYQKSSSSCAFYPLLPYTIKAISIATFLPPWVAGIVLVNVASILGLALFYKLVSMQCDRETATYSLLLMLAAPGALFYSVLYTEGLFLLLVMLFFMSIEKNDSRTLFCVGLLLPLSKAIGVFCLIPAILRFLTEKAHWRRYVPLYGLLIGYVAYFAIMKSATGNWFEGFDAQRYFPNQPSLTNLARVEQFVERFGAITDWNGIRGGAVDRGMFLLYVMAIPMLWFINRPFFAFALVSGLIPGLSTQLVSFTRNVMSCFPIFVAGGYLGRKPAFRMAFFGTVILLSAFQFVRLIRFLNFHWGG